MSVQAWIREYCRPERVWRPGDDRGILRICSLSSYRMLQEDEPPPGPIDREGFEYLTHFLRKNQRQQQQEQQQQPREEQQEEDPANNAPLHPAVPSVTWAVTGLHLDQVQLLRDGSLTVLQDLFAPSSDNSNNMLTSVEFQKCDFRTGVALGKCINALLKNPKIKKLTCKDCMLCGERTIRAFTGGGLKQQSTQKSLKVLQLTECRINLQGLGLIADALTGTAAAGDTDSSSSSSSSNSNSGNTSLEVLDIGGNDIGPRGLVHITRLIESTCIEKIDFGRNMGVLNNVTNENITTLERFVHVLSQAKFLKTLHYVDYEITYQRLSGSTASMIFHALESPLCQLQELWLGRINVQWQQGIDRLVQSLPSMKNLKRLALDRFDLGSLQRHAGFLPALRRNPSLEQLGYNVTRHNATSVVYIIDSPEYNSIFIRNRQLKRARSLGAASSVSVSSSPQQQEQQPQPTTTTHDGVWQASIVKFAQCPVGASAIFHVLQKCAGLFNTPESQQHEPAAAAAAFGAVAAVQVVGGSSRASTGSETDKTSALSATSVDRKRSHDNDNDDGSSSSTATSTRSDQKKRARPSL